jgi:hypothetical protein
MIILGFRSPLEETWGSRCQEVLFAGDLLSNFRPSSSVACSDRIESSAGALTGGERAYLNGVRAVWERW